MEETVGDDDLNKEKSENIAVIKNKNKKQIMELNSRSVYAITKPCAAADKGSNNFLLIQM